MAEVKKKPAVKKAAPKKAAVKKAAAPKVEEVFEEEAAITVNPNDAPEDTEPAVEARGVSADEVSAMIADAVGKATQEIIKTLTSVSPQTMPDAPAVEEEVDIELLELADPIGAQLAKKDGYTPGGKVIEADVLETPPLTKEAIDNMSDEEIAAYNQREQRKLQARKQAQATNRSNLERMNSSQRIRALTGERDPNIIREADNPFGERMVECVTIRRVGLGEQGTSDVDERIKVPLSGARHLQDQGAIKVMI